MRKRPLGRTGIDVSELALGTWGLSGEAYGPIAPAVVDAVLDRALALGIDVFDTSDAYGRGEVEKKLGERLPEAGVTIVTRIGTDLGAAIPRRRFDAAFVRASFERSEARLQKGAAGRRIAVLLHNPTMVALGADDGLSVLRELREAGRIAAFGVSAGDVETARSALAHGAEVLELAYNFLFAGDLHELSGDLAERRPGVLARSILAHGLLAGQWSADREFHEGDHRQDRWTREELRTRLTQLELLRPAVGGAVHTLRAAALRFVLANDLVSSAVLGPRSVAQLEQLVREAGDGPPYLREPVLASLADRLRDEGILEG